MILKRGIPQCYELPSITIFPTVLYPIFDCLSACWGKTIERRDKRAKDDGKREKSSGAM